MNKPQKHATLGDLLRANFTPEQLDEIKLEAEIISMSLKELRRDTGKTQKDMAGSLGVNQSQVSRIEKAENHTIENLRRYVEALGGELEMIVKMGDKKVRLNLT